MLALQGHLAGFFARQHESEKNTEHQRQPGYRPAMGLKARIGLDARATRRR